MFRKEFIRFAFLGASTLHNAGLGQLPPIRFLSSTIKRIFLQNSTKSSTPFLVIKRDNLQYCIPDPLISNYILKEFEPQTRQVLKRSIHPGMVVVDVGANIGYHTLLAAQLVGTHGKVYAVEPGPDNLEFLQENIQRNGLLNIDILPCAAGVIKRDRNFYLRKHSSLHSFYNSKNSSKTITIQEVPLDEVIKDKVDFIKIDVEGGEIDVLMGMKQTLQSNPEIQLIVEWNPPILQRLGRSLTELPEFLLDLGFSLLIIEEKTVSFRSFESIIKSLQTNSLDMSSYWNIYAKYPTQ